MRRVPLIVHAPARFSPCRRADNVSLVDLLATLGELAGLDADGHAPEPLDGESLVALCAGAAAERAAPVFAEITSEGVPAPMLMVEEGHFKLVTGGAVPTELFDLASDPHERRSVADLPEMEGVRRRLEARAEARWDVEALDAAIRLSQRRRRLVDDSHQHGAPPPWEHQPTDPTTPWLLRGRGLYNDWAWQGIG